MIWVLLGALLFALFIYLLAPLLKVDADAQLGREAELGEARTQLAQVEADAASGRIGEAEADQSRTALEQRVLALLDDERQAGDAHKRARLGQVLVPAVLGFGALVLYPLIGDPAFKAAPDAPAPPPQVQSVTLEDVAELVPVLERRLAEETDPPIEMVVLYARSLILLERYDEASATYERALAMSGNHPQLVAEFDRAKAIIAAGGLPSATNKLPALDEQTMQNAEAMSEDDRAAMIEGMVTRLADRLAEQPDDAQGWSQLIRARVVLGQGDQAQTDLDRAFEVFEADPETRSRLAAQAVELGLNIPE